MFNWLNIQPNLGGCLPACPPAWTKTSFAPSPFRVLHRLVGQIALWGHAPTLGIGSIDYYVVPEPLVAEAWRGGEETAQRGSNSRPEQEDAAACMPPPELSTATRACPAGEACEGEGLGDLLEDNQRRRRPDQTWRGLSGAPVAGGRAGDGVGGNTAESAGGASRLGLGVAVTAAAVAGEFAAEEVEEVPPVPDDGLEGTEGAPAYQRRQGGGLPGHDCYASGIGEVECVEGGALCSRSARPSRREDVSAEEVMGPGVVTTGGESIGSIAPFDDCAAAGLLVDEGFDDDDFDDDDDDDSLVYEHMLFGDAFDGIYDDVYDDDMVDGDEREFFFSHRGDGQQQPQEEGEGGRRRSAGFSDDDGWSEGRERSEDGGRSDADWPSPLASVDYAETVEEQVVFLESLGAFVQPPGWGGRLGTGRLARLADAAEVRRR